MCNLNVVVKLREFKGQDLMDLMNLMICATSSSYKHNSDGDGYYFDEGDYQIKSGKKIDLLPLSDYFGKSHFILSHQRLATHGKSVEYTHPFSNEDFVLIHNGILHSFTDGYNDPKSDTYRFFMKLSDTFYEIEKKDREEMEKFPLKKSMKREDMIIKAIRILLDDNYGSYSICLYDKKTRLMYYFKNYSPNIYFYRNKQKEVLYITTEKDNKEFLDMYMGGKDWDTFDINDFEIYRVKVDEEDQKIKVFCIGKIKRKDSYSSYSNTSSSSYDDDKKLSESFNNISSHRDFPSNINIIAKTKGMGNDLEGITEDWNDNLDRTSSTSNQSSHQESKKSRKRRLKKIKHRDDWEYTDRKVKCESCGRYCHNVSLFEDDKGKKHNTYWCDTCILETDSIVEEGMNNVPFTNLELEQIDEWGIDISNGGYEQNYFDDRKFLTSDMTREERENIVRGIIWNQSKKDVKAKVEIKKFDDFSRIGITPEKVFVEEIEGDGGEIPREKSEIPSITEKVQEWEKEALEREKEEEAKKEIEQSKNISEIEIGDDLNKKVSELTREYPLGVG